MATPERLEKIERAVSLRQRGLVVVMENVSDPHNVQAVARSCDAFGIQDIYVITEDVESFDPKRIGFMSSSSANKWLDYHIYESTTACFNALHEQDYTIMATALSDEAETIYDVDLRDEKLALVFGNERIGISETVYELADRFLLIPMAGMVQSLNISVAAAVTMYETVRQRKGSPETYQLSADKQKKLIDDFLSR